MPLSNKRRPSNERPPSLKTTYKLETDVQYNQSIYLRSCLINTGVRGLGCWHRLQNSRFRKARSAVSVILECKAREPHSPARRVRHSPFLHSLQTFRSNMVRRSRWQRIRLSCSLMLTLSYKNYQYPFPPLCVYHIPLWICRRFRLISGRTW